MSSHIPPLHPSVRPVVELIEALGVAAEIAARQAARATFRAVDRRPGHARLAPAGSRPAGESATPLWDVMAAQLRVATARRGVRARLARHLGLPRQRLNDFLHKHRQPDADITLRLLHWLTELEAGRDVSLLVPPDPERFPPAAPSA
ncbi:MAG: hypothetical protein MUE42_06395 [Opitutaceae bacterium]|jgi:hypothetical protein|nr:hypothetical protein [Opitutaceae bacterium]